MADSFIQLPADSTGKQLDTTIVNMGVGTTEVHREKMVVSDPASTSGFAPVTSSAGLLTNVSSGVVNLGGQSSAISIVFASNQAVAVVDPISAVGMPVTTSFGGLTQFSSGGYTIRSLSSGNVTLSSAHIVSLSSGTVTLSSAPLVIVASSSPITQTLTVVSASSGLIQISGTPAVTSTSVILSTAGITQVYNVSTAGAVGPVSSSFGVLVNQTTASIPSIVNATSANPAPVIITSSGAISPTTVVASTISKVSSSAGALYFIDGFTTASAAAVIRLYNATTSNVTMNTGVVAYLLAGAQSSATPAPVGAYHIGPRPMNFATACSLDVVVTVTSTATVAGNTYITFQYV